MPRQVLVVGLGQFGMALVRALAERGAEVMAVDRNPALVDRVAPFVGQAVAFDATDEEELARAEPHRRDVAVCAIGNEARDASIICTTLLRQLGAPRVVARAADPLHERILKLVGAHEVVNPERAFGERLATRLSFRGVLEQIPLGDELTITELRVPPVMVGRNLAELKLRRRFHVNVVAIRRRDARGRVKVVLPLADQPLQEGDILIAVGKEEATARFLERA